MISSCGSSVNACNVTDTIFGTHLLLYHAVFCILHVTYTIPPLWSEGFGRRMQLLYYATCARTRTRYRFSARHATTLVARPQTTETFLCMLNAPESINWPYLSFLGHFWGQHNTWQNHNPSHVIAAMSMYLLHMIQVMEHHIMQLAEFHIVREARPREGMHLGTYL